MATTALVTALSYGVPEAHSATAVGAGFLGVTYLVALGPRDPEGARRYGLSLGGLFDPEPLDLRRILGEGLRELGVALGLALLVFPPFWAAWILWWSPPGPFRAAPLGSLGSDALGQILVIALPEEAFYRGYLQSSLDEGWPPGRRVLGASLGVGVIATSALFALGHVATEVRADRLAVFFPSLLFGWLRARRGGVGASVAFHAACNLFATFLARSYGLS